MSTETSQPVLDERVATVSVLRAQLLKPEFGSVVGAVVLFAFFAAQSAPFHSVGGVANWLDPASTYGIMAVCVALLMIGGHFDLSAGVQLATAGLVTSILTVNFHLYIWASLVVSLAVCLSLGFLNGYLVIRTKLPSFIITLASFLMLQGLNLGLTKYFTGTVSASGIAEEVGYSGPHNLFAHEFVVQGQSFYVAILWWIAFTVVASFILTRTKFGNWVFAVGGDENASRNVGVPAMRTTISLFMFVSFCAWFVGNIYLFRLTSMQASTGIGFELYYIAAAVIGGCLLTGGYGSAIGASVGAVIIGMTQQGIVYAQWNNDWFKLFLGGMLLLAVLTNQFVRRYAEQSRK